MAQDIYLSEGKLVGPEGHIDVSALAGDGTSGALIEPPIGKWSVSLYTNTADSGFGTDVAYMSPVPSRSGWAYDQFNVNVTTGAAGATLDVFVFDDDGGIPGNRLALVTGVDAVSAALKSVALPSFTSPGRLLWAGVIVRGASVSIRRNAGHHGLMWGDATKSLTAECAGLSVAMAGAVPSTWPGGQTVASVVPNVGLRRSA